MEAWLFALGVSGGVLAVLWGLHQALRVQTLARERWRAIWEAASGTEAPRGPSWPDRVEAWVRKVRVPAWLSARVPEGKIVASGWTRSPHLLWAWIWWQGQIGLALLGLTLVALAGGKLSLGAGLLLALGIGAWSAFPVFWLHRRYQQRRRAVLRSLPDFLDLLTLTVEAGLGFEPALKYVARDFPGPWGEEVRRALQRMALGIPRTQALREAARRVDVEEARSFVEALHLAQRLGTPLGRTLRIQSRLLRMRRKQRAQVAAYTAPVRLVPALVFLFLPGLLLIYLVPPLLFFLFLR